jgi:hypothetical protein
MALLSSPAEAESRAGAPGIAGVEHSISTTPNVDNSIDSEWRQMSISPAAPGTTVNIRVVYANNPRLPKMSSGQLRTLLAAAQRTTLESFGVNVRFSVVAEMEIDRLFKMIPPRVIEARKSTIYDFRSANEDLKGLAEGIYTTLTQRQTKLEDGLFFAAPYLPDVKSDNLATFSVLLGYVMLERLGQWRQVSALGGTPVVDTSPYNEWIYWDSLGYGALKFDLVITNQLIASAEYVGVDIHSAIRGGVSVGTTSFSRIGKFGSFIFWCTFPFTDPSEISKSMRGGEDYSDTEAAELSGAYLAHEIGHMLFRYGHPFGQTACVMNPVTMLKFREWYQQINSASCPAGSGPEMTPGNVPLFLNKTWLRLARLR